MKSGNLPSHLLRTTSRANTPGESTHTTTSASKSNEEKFYENNEGRIIIVGTSLNPAVLCAEHAVVPQCRESTPTWRTVIGDARQAFLGMHEATPLPSQEGASLSLAPKLAMSCR